MAQLPCWRAYYSGEGFYPSCDDRTRSKCSCTNWHFTGKIRIYWATNGSSAQFPWGCGGAPLGIWPKLFICDRCSCIPISADWARPLHISISRRSCANYQLLYTYNADDLFGHSRL